MKKICDFCKNAYNPIELPPCINCFNDDDRPNYDPDDDIVAVMKDAYTAGWITRDMTTKGYVNSDTMEEDFKEWLKDS